MSSKRTKPQRRRRGWLRLFAAAMGLLALAVPLAPGAAAQADPDPADDSGQTFSTAQLKKASDAVLTADVDGTMWWVDKERNKVVVEVDETVSAAEVTRIERRANGLADALTIKQTKGKLRPAIGGGDGIYASPGARYGYCSLGFNVRSGDTYYLLTAGHCTNESDFWWTDPARTTQIGPTVGSSYPGNDYGLVQYTNDDVPRPGTVNLYNGSSWDITHAADPTDGQFVVRSGRTTGLAWGNVIDLNVMVNYPGEGNILYGLILTNVCMESGDSGGPLFSPDHTALGLASGFSGNCDTGGRSLYQPVVEALNAYGVNVY